MEEIKQIVRSLVPHGPFDALAVGVVDFKTAHFEMLEATMCEEEIIFSSHPHLFFDLASLTKPLTNSLSYFLKKEAFTKDLQLCLNHRAGLPAWGLLPALEWERQILNYPIKESETLYSDFSALRVMLELGKQNIDQKKLCQQVWDKELLNWLDLPIDAQTPQYGFKNGLPNLGVVHDPNAFVINKFCSHAGLFGTIGGVCRTLLSYQSETDFISQVKTDLAKHTHRFSYGWDRVENPKTSLAGVGCSAQTFGHLGFTGTSIWIDAEKMLAHIILSNATKYHWYDKQNLNDLRRAVGEVVWKTQVFKS